MEKQAELSVPQRPRSYICNELQAERCRIKAGAEDTQQCLYGKVRSQIGNEKMSTMCFW